MFAAAPEWLSDNVTLIALALLVVIGLVIARFVTKLVTRLVVAAVLVALAIFAYANRGELEECARTCDCRLAGQDISLPACGEELDRL